MTSSWLPATCGLPLGPGPNHDTFMPMGATNRTSVRWAANGGGDWPISGPTAATAPGGGTYGPIGPIEPIGPGPVGPVMPGTPGENGTPGGVMPPAGYGPAGMFAPACMMP